MVFGVIRFEHPLLGVTMRHQECGGSGGETGCGGFDITSA